MKNKRVLAKITALVVLLGVFFHKSATDGVTWESKRYKRYDGNKSLQCE